MLEHDDGCQHTKISPQIKVLIVSEVGMVLYEYCSCSVLCSDVGLSVVRGDIKTD